ncbi:hypothetical protein HID58_074978, partial [Brassica napus]
MYQQDSLVDITLKVCDLFIPNTDIWDKKKVRETLTPEDAERVLRLKPSLSRLDSDVWGLTKHMGYTTQSAYQLLLDSWSLMHVHESRNIVSTAIAVSVTADLRTQSYVATGGPSWLSHTILSEAQA